MSSSGLGSRCWLERTVAPSDLADRVIVPSPANVRVVTFENSCAPREPFERLIYERTSANPVQVLATQELKDFEKP